MNGKLVRKATSNECMYMDFQDLIGGLSIPLVLEIDGTLDVSLLNKTMEELLKTRYGFNLCYEDGFWLHAQNKISFKEIMVDSEEVFSNHEFFDSQVDFRSHTLAASIIKATDSGKQYLCFNFFHGVTDGHGALVFVYDFFKLMRGEILGAVDFEITDISTVERNPHINLKIPMSCQNRLKSKGKFTGQGVAGKCLRVERSSNSMVANLVAVIARQFRGNDIIFMIPTDIRMFTEKGKGFPCGNLSLPIYLHVSEKDTPEHIYTRLLDNMKDKIALNSNAANYLHYSQLNHRIRKTMAATLLRILKRKKHFILAALISNVGKVNPELLTCKDFVVTDILVPPMAQPLAAFTVASIQYGTHINLSIGWDAAKVPQCLVDTVEKEFIEQFESLTSVKADMKRRES